MRRMLVAAAVLAFSFPAVALGQGRHEGRGGQNEQGEEHGRGHHAQAGPRRDVAENRDRRDFERGRDFRGGDYRGERERGRHFSYRGRQYAAVRGAQFRYPRGWGYRAWRRGEFLPRLFIAAPYFIDFAYLGLPRTPPGTRWVRYGPDALLIDVYDGRIVDVIYDAFY